VTRHPCGELRRQRRRTPQGTLVQIWYRYPLNVCYLGRLITWTSQGILVRDGDGNVVGISNNRLGRVDILSEHTITRTPQVTTTARLDGHTIATRTYEIPGNVVTQAINRLQS
jgi:hypothetical protein